MAASAPDGGRATPDLWAYWRGSVDERLKTVEQTTTEVRGVIREVKTDLTAGMNELKAELKQQTNTLQNDIKDQIKQTYRILGVLSLAGSILMFLMAKIFGVK